MSHLSNVPICAMIEKLRILSIGKVARSGTEATQRRKTPKKSMKPAKRFRDASPPPVLSAASSRTTLNRKSSVLGSLTLPPAPKPLLVRRPVVKKTGTPIVANVLSLSTASLPKKDFKENIPQPNLLDSRKKHYKPEDIKKYMEKKLKQRKMENIKSEQSMQDTKSVIQERLKKLDDYRVSQRKLKQKHLDMERLENEKRARHILEQTVSFKRTEEPVAQVVVETKDLPLNSLPSQDEERLLKLLQSFDALDQRLNHLAHALETPEERGRSVSPKKHSKRTSPSHSVISSVSPPKKKMTEKSLQKAPVKVRTKEQKKETPKEQKVPLKENPKEQKIPVKENPKERTFSNRQKEPVAKAMVQVKEIKKPSVAKNASRSVSPVVSTASSPFQKPIPSPIIESTNYTSTISSPVQSPPRISHASPPKISSPPRISQASPPKIPSPPPKSTNFTQTTESIAGSPPRMLNVQTSETLILDKLKKPLKDDYSVFNLLCKKYSLLPPSEPEPETFPGAKFSDLLSQAVKDPFEIKEKLEKKESVTVEEPMSMYTPSTIPVASVSQSVYQSVVTPKEPSSLSESIHEDISLDTNDAKNVPVEEVSLNNTNPSENIYNDDFESVSTESLEEERFLKKSLAEDPIKEKADTLLKRYFLYSYSIRLQAEVAYMEAIDESRLQIAELDLLRQKLTGDVMEAEQFVRKTVSSETVSF
jgi:hypothetical protein